MSFASALNTLPNKLLRPNSVAIVTSLCFHALLFAALPNLSLSSREEARTRSVQVTELSSAEQARLPNFSASLDSYAPDASVINPPLNTFPLELPNATTLLPPPSAQSQAPVTSVFPSLPAVPLPPPPTDTFVPPTLTSPAPTTAPPDSTPTPSESSPPPSASAPTPLNTLPPLPRRTTLPTFPQNPNTALRFPPPPPPTNARDLFNQGRANTAEAIPPSTSARDLLNQRASSNQPSPTPAAPTPAAPTPAAPTDVETLRQQQLVAEVLELRASLAKDETDTTNEEALKNDLNWRQANQVAEPKQISLTGTYPEDACIVQAEGTATYGVVVDAQGNIASTELIKSAGYPILNNQALEQVKSHSFEQNGASYLASVNFQYSPETCPSLGTAPPETAESSPQPSPPPAPANAPVAPPPTPEVTQEAPAAQPEVTQEAPQPPASDSDQPQQLTDPKPITDTAPQPAPSPAAPAAVDPTPQPAPSPAVTSDEPSETPLPAPAANTTPEPTAPEPEPNAGGSEALGGPIEVPNPLMQPRSKKTAEDEAER